MFLLLVVWEVVPPQHWHRTWRAVKLSHLGYDHVKLRDRLPLNSWKHGLWWTEPQEHWLGSLVGSHPLQTQSVSLNACLGKEKPCSSIGRVISRADAPFSGASSRDFWRAARSVCFRAVIFMLFFPQEGPSGYRVIHHCRSRVCSMGLWFSNYSKVLDCLNPFLNFSWTVIIVLCTESTFSSALLFSNFSLCIYTIEW